MKYIKSISALLLFLLISSAIIAQTEEEKVPETAEKEIETMKPKKAEFQEPAFAMDIEIGSKANSSGIHNAYSIELLDADQKIVEKAWRQMMKSYKGKTKFNRKESEFGTTSAKITELGSAAYSVKASIEQRGENVVIHSWYEGVDGYVNESLDSEDSGVRELLNGFATGVRKEMVKLNLDQEEKNLKQVENELSKLKRQHDGYHRDIEIAKKKIAEAEQNIIENEAQQEEAIAKIDGQRAIVESVRQRLKRIN